MPILMRNWMNSTNSPCFSSLMASVFSLLGLTRAGLPLPRGLVTSHLCPSSLITSQVSVSWKEYNHKMFFFWQYILFVNLVKIPALLAAVSDWVPVPRVPALLDEADVVMPGGTKPCYQRVSTWSSMNLHEPGSGNALQFLPDLESLLNTGQTNSWGGPGAGSLSSSSGLGLEIVGRGPDWSKIWQMYIPPFHIKSSQSQFKLCFVIVEKN